MCDLRSVWALNRTGEHSFICHNSNGHTRGLVLLSGTVLALFAIHLGLGDSELFEYALLRHSIHNFHSGRVLHFMHIFIGAEHSRLGCWSASDNTITFAIRWQNKDIMKFRVINCVTLKIHCIAMAIILHCAQSSRIRMHFLIQLYNTISAMYAFSERILDSMPHKIDWMFCVLSFGLFAPFSHQFPLLEN